MSNTFPLTLQRGVSFVVTAFVLSHYWWWRHNCSQWDRIFLIALAQRRKRGMRATNNGTKIILKNTLGKSRGGQHYWCPQNSSASVSHVVVCPRADSVLPHSLMAWIKLRGVPFLSQQEPEQEFVILTRMIVITQRLHQKTPHDLEWPSTHASKMQHMV